MRFLITYMALCCVLGGSAQTKDGAICTQKSNYFYVSPGDLFLNTFQLTYERKLKNCNTIAVSGGFRLSKNGNEIDRLGGVGEIQYRINLLYEKESIAVLNRSFSTFAYFAPYLLYRYEDITDFYRYDFSRTQTATTIVNSGFGGVGFGIRLTALENRFTMNFFAGGGLKYSEVNGLNKYSDFLDVGYTGIAPKVSFQMGIAF